jgi:hypothetical protein
MRQGSGRRPTTLFWGMHAHDLGPHGRASAECLEPAFHSRKPKATLEDTVIGRKPVNF